MRELTATSYFAGWNTAVTAGYQQEASIAKTAVSLVEYDMLSFSHRYALKGSCIPDLYCCDAKYATKCQKPYTELIKSQVFCVVLYN